MANIAYLIKESGMGFNEVLDLPHVVFLSLIKQFRIMAIASTEEGRKALMQAEMLNKKDPDWSRLSKLNVYKKRQGR